MLLQAGDVGTDTHVGRFENGKFVEHWGNSDDPGMMQQMGAVPLPGQGAGQEPPLRGRNPPS